MAIKAGNYLETSARFAGVGPSTLRLWMQRGRRANAQRTKDNKYYQFVKAVETAMAEAEVRDVATIAKASELQWQAAAWRLERRYPERWSKSDKHRIDMKAEINVESRSAKKQLASLIAGIAERIRDQEDDRGNDET